MTQITKTFFDEVDNYYEIERALERGRYHKPFLFLYDYLFSKKNKWINCISFQKATFIYNQGNAYQILSSFCVLNLLAKQHIRNKVIFYIINDSWWHTLKKKLDKKEGETNGSRGSNPSNPEV